MRRWRHTFLVLCAGLVLGSPLHAEFLSKTFVFKAGVALEIAADLGDGLRLDTVRFFVPEEYDRETYGAAPYAEVQVSNLGAKSRMFGVAIAILDESGKLLAAAHGGPKAFPLRTLRQGTYRVTFRKVNAAVASAARFSIALESAP